MVDADQKRGETESCRACDDKPLLVLSREGKGRVALLLSDQGWLWARGYDGGGPQTELLRRIAHWLMKEPDLEEEPLSGHQDQTAISSSSGGPWPIRCRSGHGHSAFRQDRNGYTCRAIAGPWPGSLEVTRGRPASPERRHARSRGGRRQCRSQGDRRYRRDRRQARPGGGKRPAAVCSGLPTATAYRAFSKCLPAARWPVPAGSASRKTTSTASAP